MTQFFTRFTHPGALVLIAAVYTLLGKLGLSLALIHVSATAVWPPTGFALAILLLMGNRMWPGIFAGALLVNLSTTGDVASSLGIAAGNTLEAIVGAALVRRFASGAEAFNRAPDIFKFVVLGAFGSTMVSATLGVASLSLAGLAARDSMSAIWLTWWMGNAVSALIVAPLLILWSVKPWPRLDAAAVKELLLLLAPVIVVGQLVFGGWIFVRDYPLLILELPLFLWIGLRFDQRATITAAFVTCALAIGGTLNGFGPFAANDPNTSLLALQCFMAVLTVTALLMSAAVAERRQAADALRRSEERYRSLVLAGAQVVWTTSAGGDVVEDLPTWRKFTGQTEMELKGRGWMAAVHPADRERVEQVWAESLATRTPSENEFRVRAADGRYRDVFARAVPVLDSDGQVREWVGICRDITERKRAGQNQAALLTLGEQLNAATVAREAGRIISETAQNLFGWDACSIFLCDDQQRALFPIVNIDTVAGEKATVAPSYYLTEPSPLAREVMEQGGRLILRRPPFTFDAKALAFGDKTRPSASLMYVPLRQTQRVVGLFTIQSYTPDAYAEEDLTLLQSLADYCGGALERIRASEALQAAQEELSRQAAELEQRVAERTAELQDTIESLESVCYTIAHDLRAPLRALRGFGTALADDYASQLDAAGQDFCRRIVSSSGRMDHLINDLLAYGQLVHKDLPLAPVHLEMAVSSVLAQLAGEVAAKDAEIVVERPLPVVLGNATMVEQIFSNLISNALKFVAADTRPRVRIWSQACAGRVRISVQDNGIGISTEHYERIFRVFERLHGTTAYPGTGIGLAIVRKGVERMGGAAGVESQAGCGATFWIELSRAVETD